MAVAKLALSAAEAAEALGVSERTVWQWTRDGILPHVRIKGRLLYPVRALECWLEEQAIARPAADEADSAE